MEQLSLFDSLPQIRASDLPKYIGRRLHRHEERWNEPPVDEEVFVLDAIRDGDFVKAKLETERAEVYVSLFNTHPVAQTYLYEVE